MSRLARELLEEVESSGMARAARIQPARKGAFKSFEAFQQTLGMIAGFQCPGCREAGCSVTCRIRPCCLKHGFAGCWECPEFASCREFRWLCKVHGEGIVYNLRALRRRGQKGFLRDRRYWLGLSRPSARGKTRTAIALKGMSGICRSARSVAESALRIRSLKLEV